MDVTGHSRPCNSVHLLLPFLGTWNGGGRLRAVARPLNVWCRVRLLRSATRAGSRSTATTGGPSTSDGRATAAFPPTARRTAFTEGLARRQPTDSHPHGMDCEHSGRNFGGSESPQTGRRAPVPVHPSGDRRRPARSPGTARASDARASTPRREGTRTKRDAFGNAIVSRHGQLAMTYLNGLLSGDRQGFAGKALAARVSFRPGAVHPAGRR